MNARPESIDSPRFLKQALRPSGLDRLARRAVMSLLARLETGQVVISDNGESVSFGRPTDAFPQPVHLRVLHPRFYSDVVFGGSTGAGEAYIHGYWSCQELTGLLQILIANQRVLDSMDSGLARLGWPLQKLYHWSNRNTRRGSRSNISAHYDLGNDFYSLWLDSTMMYSCGYFAAPDTTLEDASVAKLERICRKLDLGPQDRVIEIGTGWGGFAIHAARRYGCHVTTTTISRQQYEYARNAIREQGLEDRITLLLQDYRDLEGEYDKLVSIEMIEAVGHEYHRSYFRKCCELLKPNGQMLLQAITIADQRYDQYKDDVDFIRRYVFPGGCLTSVTDMTRTMTQHTDMRVIHVEDIGPHYATTLKHWQERFMARLDEVRRLGYSDAFIRLWHFYLCYCEAAFIERATGDVQMLIMRPEARRDSIDY